LFGSSWVPPRFGLHVLKRYEEDSDILSLYPNDDILTKVIESWKGFADSLSTEEDRKTFTKMLNDSCRYTKAINAKGPPFPAEPVIMLFSQQKLIQW